MGEFIAMIYMKDVSKVYDNGTVALDHVNVKIEKGDFVFLVGASGAGARAASVGPAVKPGPPPHGTPGPTVQPIPPLHAHFGPIRRFLRPQGRRLFHDLLSTAQAHPDFCAG